jgi:2-dehydro-3-deoxyphosphogluconate aldolase/(4S)-4-hydroxy-2-oxoglutarate aldolase
MNAAGLLDGIKVVPVVVIDNPERAVPLAETLLSAGLPAIEITMRTPRALEALKAIADNVPDMIVGAGSIRNANHLASACEAGAQFGVSPGFTKALLEAAEYAELPFVPGAVTPSESLQLLQSGYELQKFFPASLAGGVPYLRALAAPIQEVSFMPTGGINADNVGDYLALPNVACVGGSWIVPKSSLNDGDFDAIGALAKAAASL